MEGERPDTYSMCICVHAPNNPDIIPYNIVHQCTDEKHGVNIRCLRYVCLCMCEFQDIVVVWLLC